MGLRRVTFNTLGLTMTTEIDYEGIRKAADARAAEDAKIARDALAKSRGRVHHPHCALCRRVRRSPRAFLKDAAGACLSCHKRGYQPKWVVTEHAAVGRWRMGLVPAVTQSEFARLCRWSQPRQCVVEKQPVLRGDSAVKVATAFMMLLNAGHMSPSLMSDWPLFHVISVVKHKSEQL